LAVDDTAKRAAGLVLGVLGAAVLVGVLLWGMFVPVVVPEGDCGAPASRDEYEFKPEICDPAIGARVGTTVVIGVVSAVVAGIGWLMAHPVKTTTDPVLPSRAAS
jgi:hypothetical protein